MPILRALTLFLKLLSCDEWYVIGFLPDKKHFIDADVRIDKFKCATEDFINDSLEQESLLAEAKEIIKGEDL